MAEKIQGRDINGLRPAAWPKLDVSAIEKIKINDKASNSELASAIQQMISEAVIALYGNNSDKKYIKIVDLIMLRIRGALEKLNEQTSQQNEESNAKILQSIHDSLDEKYAAYQKSLKAIADEVISKINDFSEQIQENENAAVDFSDDTLKNDKSKKINNITIKNEDEDEASKEEINSNAATFNISDILEKQENTYSFLEQLQSDITSNFQKIEQLITSNSAQKTVEQAQTQPNAANPFNEKITGQNKKTEDKLNGQLGKIDEKITGEDKQEDLKEKAKKEKEQEKADDKADKKREKSLKKKKKSTIKNVLTGKQFDKLTQLLNRQFFYVTDYSELMMKKITKQFTKINKRLDKLIKDKNAHGFSWTKFLLFASLFLLPLFWDKIMDLLKYLDEKFEINKKIDEWINNIDWISHIAKIGAFLWDAIVNVFNKYIKNPFGWIIDRVKKTYDMLTDWVKDVWKYVTGEVNKSKKTDKEQQKKQKKEEGILQATIKQYRTNVAKREQAELKAIDNAGKAKADKVKQDLDQINSKIKQSSIDIKNATNEAIQKSNEELKQTLEDVKPDAEKIIKDNQSELEKETAKIVTNASNIAVENAKAINKQIEADGSPTGISKIDFKQFGEDINSLDNGSLDHEAALADKRLGGYAGMDHYVKLKSNNDAAITTQEAMDNVTKIQSLQRDSSSPTAQKVMNANLYGVWAAGSANNFTNSSDQKSKEKAVEKHLSDPEKRDAMIQYLENSNGVNTEALLFENTAKALELVSETYHGIDESLLSSTNLLEDLKSDLSAYWTQFEKFTDVVFEKTTGEKAPSIKNVNIVQNSGSSSNNPMNANMSN